MADTKISALVAATAVVGANEFPINEAGVSKKVTAAQIKTFGSQFVKLAAGTAAAATQPMQYTSGPLLTTPEAGSMEYLTNNLYFTSNAGNRGVLLNAHLAAIQADFTLAAVATAQNCLTAATDTLTLPGNTTYLFDAQYIINTGAVTHTTALGFVLAGGMTVASFEYLCDSWSAAANTISAATNITHVSGVASKVINVTSTAVFTLVRFRGLCRVTAGGTIAPQITFSANPTGTNLMKVGSYILFEAIGTDTVAAVGNWT